MRNKQKKCMAILMLLWIFTPLIFGTSAIVVKAQNLPTLTDDNKSTESKTNETETDGESTNSGDADKVSDSLEKAKNAVGNILPDDSVGVSKENQEKANETTKGLRNVANNIVAILFSIVTAWIPVTIAMDAIAGRFKIIRPLVDGSKFKHAVVSDAFGTLTSGDKLNWGGWFKESTVSIVITLVIFALIISGTFWVIMTFLAQLVIAGAIWVFGLVKGLIS